MTRELPFFSYGNEAKGVIAIGNSAHGVLALGISGSVGVISIGMNAIGTVAIGLNAAGPISFSIINGAGVLAWAGINVIGGAGGSYANAGIAPWIGLALAVVGLVVGQVIHVPRSRPRDEAAEGAGWLAQLLEAEPGVYRVAAMLEHRDRALVLSDGDHRLPAEAAPSLPRPREGRVCCDVRVIDEFDDRGAYRVAANKRRRLVVEAIEPLPSPPGFLHSNADLDWLLARSVQAVSLVAGAICAVLALAR